jgi:hypothetical protein
MHVDRPFDRNQHQDDHGNGYPSIRNAVRRCPLVAKLLRRQLRRCCPLSDSAIHRTKTNAKLKLASLSALCIPALNDGVFRAILIKGSVFHGGVLSEQQNCAQPGR